MSVISKRFADELTDKEMRDAYLAAQTRTRIAKQIRTMRADRDWSQADLGEALGKPQSVVSRLEDREYGKHTLQTLLEVAAAYDVALIVKFATYQEFLKDTENLSPTRLSVDSFTREALNPLTEASASLTPYKTLVGSTFSPNYERVERQTRSSPVYISIVNEDNKREALHAHV